jgi:hypothetical protein
MDHCEAYKNQCYTIKKALTVYLFFFGSDWDQTQGLDMLGKHFTTELHP